MGVNCAQLTALSGLLAETFGGRKIHRKALSLNETGLPVDVRRREQRGRGVAPEVAEGRITHFVEARGVLECRIEDAEGCADAGLARTAKYLSTRRPCETHTRREVVVPHRRQALGDSRIAGKTHPVGAPVKTLDCRP